MLNLTRNAVQAGAKRIEWNLKGEASGNAVRLVVNDDGDGIVEERRARLFDSFALSDKPGGSGLGLYLIRRYIELLGGKIEVGDRSPLGGASFVIELPARAVCPKEAKSGTS
jgi:signal transduction histidine kinase